MKTHEEHGAAGEEHGASLVDVTIDDKTWRVHRGRQTVVDLKTVAGVALAYDLDQVIDGKFEPLKDDSAVTIKGGEVFISHPKDGSSS